MHGTHTHPVPLAQPFASKMFLSVNMAMVKHVAGPFNNFAFNLYQMIEQMISINVTELTLHIGFWFEKKKENYFFRS